MYRGRVIVGEPDSPPVPIHCYTCAIPVRGDVHINAPVHPVGQALSAFENPVATDVKPLRIALLGYRSAPFSGGQGVYLKYLSRALKSLGHEVSVISGPPYPHLDAGIPLHQLPSLDLYAHGLGAITWAQFWRDPLARREWWSKLTGGFVEPWTFGERARRWVLANADNFDVIHDNQTLSDGILALQTAGIPLVTTIHHPITRDRQLAVESESVWYRKLLVRRWYDFLDMQERVAKQLNHIVTVSGISRRDIVADFGVDPRRVAVMYNGVDTEVFRPLDGKDRKVSQIMAIASADTPTKGLQILLPAVAQLIAAGKQLEVVLVGKPKPEGETVQLIRALGLQEHIQWYQDLEQEQIAELYAESTIAVVPSLYEGFGLPAVEAMACGIPLISSDGGALGEVAGDAALVVPAGDVAALAAAIQELLENPARREELGRLGRARAERKFSWQACAQRLVAHYRSVIESTNQHPRASQESGLTRC